MRPRKSRPQWTAATRSRSPSSRLRRILRTTTAPCNSSARGGRSSHRARSPGRRTARRTRRRSSTTSTSSTTTCWRDPIGFTEAAGNFQHVNSTGQGTGGDAVHTEPTTARTRARRRPPVGLPDNTHRQREHRHAARRHSAADADVPVPRTGARIPHDPFVASNGGDEADIVYHEYTHGLSNRLVVDADGNSTLGGVQAGAMGEAWSDWYAMDFLDAQGLIDGHAGRRRPARRQLRCPRARPDPDRGRWTARSARPRRSATAALPGRTAGPGGYTYGDYGKIDRRVPEVHADGEIWGADAVGSPRRSSARGLTEASGHPGDGAVARRTRPFLDMRNAILQADLRQPAARTTTRSGRCSRTAAWASSPAPSTATTRLPVQDFQTPPPPNPFGKLLGKVEDPDTGKPIEGVRSRSAATAPASRATSPV